MQPQTVVVLSLAGGSSVVRETIFELVHNFKETIDKKLLEESNKYVEYKVIGRQYMYEEESNPPSEPRSDSLGDMLEYFGYV